MPRGEMQLTSPLGLMHSWPPLAFGPMRGKSSKTSDFMIHFCYLIIVRKISGVFETISVKVRSQCIRLLIFPENDVTRPLKHIIGGLV